MTLMISGDQQVFKRTAPMLAPIAKKLFYLGQSGSDHTMKVVQNMIAHTNFFALCEAAHLGRRAGIKLEDLIEVFQQWQRTQLHFGAALSRSHSVGNLGRPLAGLRSQ